VSNFVRCTTHLISRRFWAGRVVGYIDTKSAKVPGGCGCGWRGGQIHEVRTAVVEASLAEDGERVAVRESRLRGTDFMRIPQTSFEAMLYRGQTLHAL
jgi:hypothetical protein